MPLMRLFLDNAMLQIICEFYALCLIYTLVKIYKIYIPMPGGKSNMTFFIIIFFYLCYISFDEFRMFCHISHTVQHLLLENKLDFKHCHPWHLRGLFIVGQRLVLNSL